MAIAASLFGCARNGEVIDIGPSDSGATEAIVAARWDSMSAAFSRLAEGDITEHQSVEVWRRGSSRARRTASLDYVDGERVASRTIDSTGVFARGWIRNIITPLTEVKTPIAHWTDDEPPYESPRRRNLFRFSVLPDSVGGDIRLVRRRVETRSVDEPLREARFSFLSVDSTTAAGLQVVALEETRLEEAPFFAQESSIVVRLARIGGRWEAVSIVMDVSVDAPARAERRYRVERVFSR